MAHPVIPGITKLVMAAIENQRERKINCMGKPTAIPEAKLAREAEMCYALLAMGTDYDCWHEEEEDVSVAAVLATLKANSEMGKSIVKETVRQLPAESECECLRAAQYAIITAPEAISPEAKARLSGLYGHYWNE